jgi:exopolysaccharide biosynthesis WecB/TagA/CpsF family protein
MKILLVHNYYGSSAPSGENTVYAAERELLRQHGHTVIEFTRHSDGIINRGIVGKIQGASATPWNPFSKRALRFVLEKEQPEIMHVHNTFPLLSPSIFHATQGLKTATVLTLHNYRTFCAAGIPMHDGHSCTECLDAQSVSPAIKYGCYRKNRVATLPLATMIALHRRVKTWEGHVDAFVALSDFQRDKMAKAGLPKANIHIKPPFYPNPPSPLAWEERESKVIFIGRLGSEKGIHILLDAWRLWGNAAPQLEIIGDGPERVRLQESVKGNGIEDKISFLGQLPFLEVQKRLRQAQLLVLPSLCFEGFPMAIIEAFSLGVPVAASNIGPLPDIVKGSENGILFKAGDAPSLCHTMKEIWDCSDRLCSLGQGARQEFENKYTADTNYKTLMKVYDAAIENKQSREEQVPFPRKIIAKEGYRHDSENILGYPVSTLSRNGCIATVIGWIENGAKSRYFVCANPHSLEVAETDHEFSRAIKNADLVVPDGVGLIIASRILGKSIHERVTGSDIFWGVNSELDNRKGYSVFFLGSTQDNLEKVRYKMGFDFPNIRVVGTFSPPFKGEFSHEDNLMMIETINHAKPDVLWVGMTAPKQEKWIYENRQRLDVKLLGPIGAVFDFYTGNVKRSAPIYQKTGLEWLPRFLREPRRMWRRNLVSNPRFLLRIIGQRFNNQKYQF